MAANLASTLTLEGKVTKLTYLNPENRTTLEIFRNYATALGDAGFEALFECTNEICGGYDFSYAAGAQAVAGHFLGNHQGQRYLLARLHRDEATYHVSVYTIQAHSIGGKMRNRAYTHVNVVESASMKENMVTVDADAMVKGLEAEGHIALYNIYFDTDSDVLKSESDQALEEVAKMTRANPELVLLVVGHTDNVGDLKYNETLSARRAQSVVSALIEGYGVPASRLTPAGVGMYTPVASNQTEDGRKLNRRVELVER